MVTRNPYVKNGEPPRLLESVFVFMDILGFSDLIIRSNHDPEGLLQDLHEALSEGREGLEGKGISEELKKLISKDLYALKAFTDNIVIGWPVRDDAESELGMAISTLSLFQFAMAVRGYFVRGAISVGPAYIDEIAVFGDALKEAYEGESGVARDPRIILTKSAVEATKTHLGYYGSPKSAPHSREILQDADGQWFLNYLDVILIAEEEHGPFYDEFKKHKEAVEYALLKHKDNPPVWSKYSWVAAYHNYFCEMHSRYFDDQYKIDVELFRAVPKRIFEN